MMRKFVIVHEGSLPININGRVSGSFLSPISLSTIQLSTLVAYDINVYEIDPNDETNRIKITSENINCSPFKKVKNEKTFTDIKLLNEQEVINEIARISSGDVTLNAINHAKELRKVG